VKEFVHWLPQRRSPENEPLQETVFCPERCGKTLVQISPKTREPQPCKILQP
jgi:hypothetical protein